MDEQKIKQALNSLKVEYHEPQILYWLNKGWNNTQIARRINSNATNVHFQRKAIERLLEDNGIPEITGAVYDVIVKTVGDPPNWEKWPPKLQDPDPPPESPERQETDVAQPAPETSPTNVQSQTLGESPAHSQAFDLQGEGSSLEEPGSGEGPRSGSQANDRIRSEEFSGGEPPWSGGGQEIQEPRQPLRIVLWILVIMVLLLGALLFFQTVTDNCNVFTEPLACILGRDGNGVEEVAEGGPQAESEALESELDLQAALDGTLTAIAATETAIALSVTPDVTGTRMAFQASVNEELTKVAETAAAAIPTATPSNTPSPTPSLTPLPSSTPTPSFTPTATPLFEDNFDNGLNPAWQVISGEPILVNGRLTANEVTWLAVGDDSWTNYVVEFRRVSDQVSGGCGSGNVIAFRVQDRDNYISYFWHYCNSGFQVAENAKVTNIPGGTGNTREWHDFSFSVNEGQYEARLDNVIRTYFDLRYTNGGIMLKLKNNTVIDDFIVRAIE